LGGTIVISTWDFASPPIDMIINVPPCDIPSCETHDTSTWPQPIMPAKAINDPSPSTSRKRLEVTSKNFNQVQLALEKESLESNVLSGKQL